eukprot:420967_1
MQHHKDKHHQMKKKHYTYCINGSFEGDILHLHLLYDSNNNSSTTRRSIDHEMKKKLTPQNEEASAALPHCHQEFLHSLPYYTCIYKYTHAFIYNASVRNAPTPNPHAFIHNICTGNPHKR